MRVRNGETLISDGPFADTKEFIGGLDMLECENLDEAIEVAAKHPVSWFHAIELRAFDDGMDGVDIPDFIDSSELQQHAAGARRWRPGGARGRGPDRA